MCIHMLGNIVEHDNQTIEKSFLIDDDKIEGSCTVLCVYSQNGVN